MMAMHENRISASLPETDETSLLLAQMLLHDSNQFDNAARRLAKTKRSANFPIFGDSMGNSLPSGCVVRVDLGDATTCRVGDIAVFRQRDKVVAHRTLARTERHLITRGDARIAPDQPVENVCVIGRVSGVVAPKNIIPSPTMRRRHWLIRLINGFFLTTTVAATRISIPLAIRWIRFLTWIERNMPHVNLPRKVKRP
jgi:hypothetical protein